MIKARRLSVSLLALATALLAGCGGAAVGVEQMNRSYEQALVRTAAVAAQSAVSGGEAAALPPAVVAYFTAMSPESALARVSDAYAADAYFNDTLVTLDGAAAIGAYFARTAGRVRSLRVEFLDVARTGPEHYVRWRMAVESSALNDGQPMISYGMTHFRFDHAGRILLHKDFWDAGGGLYEYLPLIGTALRQVRSRVEGQS